jgi:transposase
MHTIYRLHIENCDKEIEKHLQQYEAKRNEGVIELKTVNDKKSGVKKKKDKNHPRFNVRGYLERIHGVDVLAIYGLSETGGLELLAETGTDLSKWKNENHFVSWLNLCPNNKISGGKLISSTLFKKKPNPASLAFRQAANGVQKSNNWLGDYFRRMKTKGGNKYAIIATQIKLQRFIINWCDTKKSLIPWNWNYINRNINKPK